MSVCPACGAQTTDSAPRCAQCGLTTELFEPIRQAVGISPSDPRYLDQIHDILEALGTLATEPTPAASAAELSRAGRFPSAPSAVAKKSVASPPSSAGALPERPALPAGADVPAVRQQIDEFLNLGRRQGLNLTAFTERAQSPSLSDDFPELERLAHELFVHLAASLTDALATERTDLQELAHSIPTGTLGAQLEDAQVALQTGALNGAQQALFQLREAVDKLEEEWGAVTVLLGQGELMAEAIGRLGGDGIRAVEPLDESRRLALAGDRAAAEVILANATISLWSQLSPLLKEDLARRTPDIARLKDQGMDVGPVIADLKEFATQFRLHNYTAAIDAYRTATSALDQLRESR